MGTLVTGGCRAPVNENGGPYRCALGEGHFGACKASTILFAPKEPDPLVKPPVGVIPKFLHQEARLTELNRAIREYLDANLPVLPEWVTERNELLEEVLSRG